MTRNRHIIAMFSLCLFSSSTHAGWLDFLFGDDEAKEQTTAEVVKQLSSSDIATALKQALDNGVTRAITSLGSTDGFMKNKQVSIPMPDKLAKVDKALRKIGQGKYADRFILTMNRAAESAVPLTADIMKQAVSQMTFADAKAILDGPDDSATRYLEDIGKDQMREKISPIIERATADAGVTRIYKKMLSKIEFMGTYVKVDDYDIDSYVTERTLDGLFTMIADEEKLIRQDPKKRTTDLLKSVFE